MNRNPTANQDVFSKENGYLMKRVLHTFKFLCTGKLGKAK